uniref:Uncharacterized protein n=1 Tax=Callorhinchus milii TaxID=7868 RepID=A0A4W3K678_CALMI
GDLSSDSGEAADRPTSEWPAFGHGDGQGTTPSVGVTAAGPVLSVPGSTASRPPPLTVAPGTDERVVGFVPVLSTVVGGNDASSPPATTTGWSEPPVTFPSSAAEDTGARTAETEFVPGDRGSAAASELPLDTTQVVCVDWSKLAGKSYIILNLTENTECEVFRSRNGLKLLKMVAGAFSGTLSTPEELWHISLSSEDDQHLLMMLATDRGIIPAKEVLSTLGDIKQNLKEVRVDMSSYIFSDVFILNLLRLPKNSHFTVNRLKCFEMFGCEMHYNQMHGLLIIIRCLNFGGVVERSRFLLSLSGHAKRRTLGEKENESKFSICTFV